MQVVVVGKAVADQAVGKAVAAAKAGAVKAAGHLVANLEAAASATKAEAIASGDLGAAAHAGLQASSVMQEEEHMQQEVGHVVAEVKEAGQALEEGLHGNFTGIEDNLNSQEMCSFLDGVGGAVSKLKGFLSSAKESAGDKPVDRSKIKPLERSKAEKAFAKYSHLGQLVSGGLVFPPIPPYSAVGLYTAFPSPKPRGHGWPGRMRLHAHGRMAPLIPEPWLLRTLTSTPLNPGSS